MSILILIPGILINNTCTLSIESLTSSHIATCPRPVLLEGPRNTNLCGQHIDSLATDTVVSTPWCTSNAYEVPVITRHLKPLCKLMASHSCSSLCMYVSLYVPIRPKRIISLHNNLPLLDACMTKFQIFKYNLNF